VDRDYAGNPELPHSITPEFSYSESACPLESVYDALIAS
jgi:hypothetical protein